MNRGSLGGSRGGSLMKAGAGRGAVLGTAASSLGPTHHQGAGRGQILGRPTQNSQISRHSTEERRGSSDGAQSLTKDSGLEEDLDRYNPMHAAYNDPNFNSYSGSGPGSSLRPSQHVNNRREKDTVKLHVANIHSNLSQRAIENIFNMYGDSVSVYVCDNSAGPTRWGFVEYKTVHAAQNAIANLDRKPPHNLTVKFAKEKEQRQTTYTDDINTPYCKVENSNHARQQPLRLQGTDPKKFHDNKQSHNDRDALQSNGYYQGQFCHYNSSFEVDVNNQVMEKETSTAQYQGKVVRGGRAYAPSRPPPQAREQIDSSFDKVEKFKKPSYSEEAPPPDVTFPFKQGNCTNCRDISSTVCHVCKAWYCSYACMENDWGKHKLVCRPRTISYRIDGTVEYHESSDTKSDTLTKSIDQVSDKSRKPSVSNITSDVPPRKPSEQQSGRKDDKPVDEVQAKPINTTSDEKSSLKSFQPKIDYAKHPPVPRDEVYKQTENGLISNRNAKYEENIHRRDLNDPTPQKLLGAVTQFAESNIPAELSKKAPAAEPVKKKPEPVKKEPEPPIPRGIFSKCLILYILEDKVFCVTPISHVADQDEMMADLAEYFCQPRASVTDVTEGAVCGSQFADGLWYRVKVCACNKKTGVARILFIDYGNEEEVPVKDLKVLPDSLLKPPPMSFKIVFVGGRKPFQINDAIEITPIRMTPCGCWLVRTEEDPEPPEEVQEEEANAVALPQEVVPEVQEDSSSAATQSWGLRKDKFQIVTIMHVEEPGIFWVLSMGGMKTLLELNRSLDASASCKVKVTPEKNQLYNVKFSGAWCRALLTNDDPYSVFFIDYGNALEDVDPNDLLPLPLKLKSTPPLAIRIKMAEGTSGKYLTLTEMETVTVRAYGKLSNAILVLVEGESYVQSILDHEMSKIIAPVKPKKPTHVVSMLTPKSDAFVAITKAMGQDFFCGYLQISNCPEPYQSVNEISKILKTKKANPSYKPTVDDDVIVKLDQDSRLYRGYVMFVEDGIASVALVDIGCIETPSKLTALPLEFKEIPQCGVRVTLHQPTTSSMSALLGSELTLKNIKTSEEEVTVDFGDYGRATITPWVPLLEEARLPAFTLDNKCEAMITAFHSPQAVYVRPLTPECIEVFSTVIQDVCAFCITAQPPQKPPHLGELVSARWNFDNNFYRALVSKKEGSHFKVIFLDFGNVETVELDDLRSLPDSYKKIPATVVKIGLKDVPGPLFNRPATQFMNELLVKDTKVVVSHDGDLRNSILTEASIGTIINNILIEAMEPSWANPSSSLTVPEYMNTDIRYDKWEAGDKLGGAIVGAPSHCEILFVNRSTLFDYIHSVLTPQMTKYCKETKEKAYNPRFNEVVMAKFEENWYRAVCTSHRMVCDPTATVFFIDYGNVGEMVIDDMRKMVPEFMQVPAAVKHCKVYGLPRSESISEENKAKLTAALIASESVDLIVVKQFDDGRSVVWIPAMETTLSEMGIPFSRPVGFS